MSARRFSLRLGATALLAGASFAGSIDSASAGRLLAAAPSCDDQALSKVFLPWLDPANYTPLSGGDFETAGSGWSMTGGAATANGNSPHYVGGADDLTSLSMPAGSSATSPAICVGVRHPTVRFFAQRVSGGALSASTLRVDVLFEDLAGEVVSQQIGAVTSNGNWQPTPTMPIVANLLVLLPGENTPVAFRFTAPDAAWSVDDVWVDPYHRR